MTPVKCALKVRLGLRFCRKFEYFLKFEETAAEMMQETPQFKMFKTVLFYCILILLAPISTFFLVKVVFFEGIIGTTSITSNVWSAVIAVAVLHLALGLFIYKAYSESGKPKVDKDDKID